ncbi:MAG TPA: PspC domain-containing protein, partial [Armatimonadota bacterium]|nr:PspC domain-containing protein [Armatimonadota bacterium]
YRSRNNKVIAGVIGGLGELYGVDPNILRLIYVIIAFLTGIIPAVVLYAIAWAIIPEEVSMPTT